MGCFFGCFGGPKDRKRRKAVHRIPSRSREIKAPENSRVLQPIFDQAPQIEIRPLDHSPPSKSQTLPVEIPVQDSKLKNGKDEGEKPAYSSPKKKVTFDLNVTTYEPIPLSCENGTDSPTEDFNKEERDEKEKKSTEEFSSLPENHRYHNCVADEDDDYVYESSSEEEEDEDGVEENENEEEDESYDSYFSLQMDKENLMTYDDVSSSPSKTAAAGGCRDRSQYVLSVLNPIENRSQWKIVAAKSPKNPRRENAPVLEREKENQKEDVAVDASLSNWLSPMGRSPDENSVKGIPNSTSKYREDRRVIWHSTPFKDRLERTLDRGAGAY